MEQVRNAKLDNICEGIADDRATMNAAQTSERGLIQTALQIMQAKGVSVYRHARVGLALIPGAAKIRVRLTKEEGDAEVRQQSRAIEDESPADIPGDVSDEVH